MGGIGSKENDEEEGLPVRYARGLSSSEFHKQFRMRRMGMIEGRNGLEEQGSFGGGNCHSRETVQICDGKEPLRSGETGNNNLHKGGTKNSTPSKVHTVVKGLVAMLGPVGDGGGAGESPKSDSTASLITYDEARRKFESGDHPSSPRNKEVFRQMEDLGLGNWNNGEWIPTKVIAPAIRNQVSASIGPKLKAAGGQIP